MNRTFLLVSAIFLSFFGIADSWYLYQSAATDTALSCDIGAGLDGCNIVAQSVYSSIFGLPLALYGVGFFSLLFIVSFALVVMPFHRLYGAFLALSIVGTIASLIFLSIQLLLIKAVCIYCMASAGIAFLLLAVSWTLWKRFGQVNLTVIEE